MKDITNYVLLKYVGEKSSLIRFMEDKYYKAISKTKDGGLLRIIDETGEDYLYSPNNFEIIEGSINDLVIE